MEEYIKEDILFEIIPPPENWESEKIKEWAFRCSDLLRENDLKFLNLPEVINENRGKRTVPYSPKVDNVRFSEFVRGYSDDHNMMLNKICVRIDKKDFELWSEEIYKKGIRYLVLVGGDSSEVNYPGYSVCEASEFIKKRYPDIELGGITIFTRPYEVERIIRKINSGITYFVSQIIYETANMKQVLLHLRKRLSEEGLEPPKVFISLALASRNKDIEFMKWLGVEFPSAVKSYLLEDGKDVQKRTSEVLERILDETFRFTKQEKINLGFNVEYVMYNNLGLSTELITKIKRRMRQ